MMIRWWFSAELRRSMSNMVFSGRKGVPISGSRGFHYHGCSGLPCSLPSSTSAHSAAASGIPPRISIYSILSRTLSSSSSQEPATDAANAPHFGSTDSEQDKDSITLGEAKKLMRLANVGSLKEKLGTEGKEVIGYKELIDESINIGISKSPEEAAAFVRSLDEAGVILLFRDKVYLHPDKVVKLVSKAVPLALSPQDDPMWDELKKLQERKEEIDVLAHKQVRRVLWSGLGFAILQVGLFFRLTFWEFSWDVMEPIAFFTTTTGLVIGYAYFLFTSRDPTYQDFMNKLFLSRQRKLLKKHGFDINRFVELQKKCNCPHHANNSIKNRMGLDLDLEDACHKH